MKNNHPQTTPTHTPAPHPQTKAQTHTHYKNILRKYKRVLIYFKTTQFFSGHQAVCSKEQGESKSLLARSMNCQFQMFLKLNDYMNVGAWFSLWIVTHTVKQKWNNVYGGQDENGGCLESFLVHEAHNSKLHPWME